VTQDAFVAAWRELPRLRDPERFLPWLRRILVNGARDEGRRSRRRVRQIDLSAAHTAPERRTGRDDPAGDVDRLTDLHRALAIVPVEQRAVVALHYLADLTLADVAATLGIPEGTAKSRLNAALAVLRRELGEVAR
jgi:RNA polymerase sigma-70 factor (ECF subfamily)